MSRTGMPVARSLAIVASQSRSRSLKRRRPSLPRSMAGSRPMRSYQRRVYWDRPHFAAASPMVQVVTIRAYELERALTQMRSPESWGAGLSEPGAVGAEEVAIGQVVEDPSGLAEAGRDLADDGQVRGPDRGGRQRGAVPPGAEVLQRFEGGGGGQLVPFARRNPGRAQQAGGVQRTERVGGRVVRKHSRQEQGHVAEPAVDAGPGFLRNRFEHPGQPDRVKLAEPPRARPPAGPDPVTPAGHPGEGRQQFGQEQPSGRGTEEVAQF